MRLSSRCNATGAYTVSLCTQIFRTVVLINDYRYTDAGGVNKSFIHGVKRPEKGYRNPSGQRCHGTIHMKITRCPVLEPDELPMSFGRSS